VGMVSVMGETRRSLELRVAPHGRGIDMYIFAVRLKAYPDTTLTEDARQIPWRIFALRYRNFSFPRSQKSRDLGEPRLRQSRFLTAKAVRNDKR